MKQSGVGVSTPLTGVETLSKCIPLGAVSSNNTNGTEVPAPKGYKQTKVGVIPEDWEVVRLGDIAIKISDGLHSTPKYKDNSKYFFINGNNLVDNRIYITKNTKSVSYDEYLKYKRNLTNRTILMSINGTIGNLALYNKEDVILGKSACYINLKDENSLSYIFFQLGSSKVQAFFVSELTGSTIKNLSLKTIKNTRIPLPPLKEQQKIAQILSTWDDAISKQEELIKTKERLKKGLMQKLLSGKGKKHWKFTKLSDLLKYEQPTKYLVSNKDYDNSYKTPVLTAGKTFILGYTKEENGIFKEELPVIIFDDFTTATKYVDFPFKAKSSAMKILKAKNESVNIKLVFEMMQMINYNSEDHKRYWISIYQELEIKFPPNQEQEKIAQVLTLADKEIELLKEELDGLKEQKRGLMQGLLSGWVRVNKIKEKEC